MTAIRQPGSEIGGDGRCTLLFHEPRRFHWLLYIALLGVYLLLVAQGFGPFISDDHPFRQTQTALTIRSFSEWRDFFYYRIPILGPPWTIPFEFPIYQAIVRGLEVLSGLRLETCGRLVSVLFFLASWWPISRLLDVLGVTHKKVVAALLLLAPVYVFWSRSVMIETTALFFSLVYLAEFARVYRKDGVNALDLAVILGFGTLAALTKVTTFAPLCLVASAAMLLKFVPTVFAGRGYGKWLALGLVHLAILLVTIVWIRHTDALKSLSPLGEMLTSSQLSNWNFGPLEQRLDPRIWFALLNNSSDMFFPFPRHYMPLKAALVALLAAIFGYAFSNCGRQRRQQVLVLLGLFVLPFIIFTNLHRIHNYYQVANGWLAILALALALIGAYEAAPDARRRCIIAAMHLGLLGVFFSCSLWYLHFKNTGAFRYPDLTTAIQRETPADAVLIITGLDWSPEVPYYANRRALMRMEATKGTATWDRALTQLRQSGVPVAAYVACGSGPDPQVTKQFTLADGGETFDGCILYRVAVPYVAQPPQE